MSKIIQIDQDDNTNKNNKGKNLDNVDFTNKKIRIQTPHSKMVLEELGLEEEKLYKISKKEYLDNHPELKQEKQEIQDKRYEHYEKRRQEAIDQARQIRTDIINKENEKEGKEVSDGKKNEAQQSGMIKKELEKLELIKKQQLGEIKNLIDYEYSLNETRKKNEQKEREKSEKEERMRKEKMRLQKLKEQKMKEKEEEKKEKQRKEEEETIRKYNEMERKKLQEQQEEEAKQKQMQKERQRKQEEAKKASDELRKKVEKYQEDLQNELKKKQEELEEKEMKRIKNMEERRRKENEIKKKLQEEAKERIRKALEKNDLELQKKRKEPKHIFEIDGKIQEQLRVVGQVIPMMNQAGGVIPGKVIEVQSESVKMDFNHALAGKELHFSGKVTGVRDATEKELTDGLHGERAAQCNHDCSSCGGGCGN